MAKGLWGATCRPGRFLPFALSSLFWRCSSRKPGIGNGGFCPGNGSGMRGVPLRPLGGGSSTLPGKRFSQAAEAGKTPRVSSPFHTQGPVCRRLPSPSDGRDVVRHHPVRSPLLKARICVPRFCPRGVDRRVGFHRPASPVTGTILTFYRVPRRTPSFTHASGCC